MLTRLHNKMYAKYCILLCIGRCQGFFQQQCIVVVQSYIVRFHEEMENMESLKALSVLRWLLIFQPHRRPLWCTMPLTAKETSYWWPDRW